MTPKDDFSQKTSPYSFYRKGIEEEKRIFICGNGNETRSSGIKGLTPPPGHTSKTQNFENKIGNDDS